MTHKGWRVVKPQHNQIVRHALNDRDWRAVDGDGKPRLKQTNKGKWETVWMKSWTILSVNKYAKYHSLLAHYSPALKKWGYTGFAISFCDSVFPWFCDCKIKMHFA